jgi:hypothetical protein
MSFTLFIVLLIFIYIITVVINMYITHKECEYRVYTLGELFDRMERWMFIPILNTIILISLVLCICIYLIIDYTGIIKIWNKIRNIKL